eukprot:TRINITY_DN884_c0_g1_i1.p1 TRINITY_DN884_c0_g1~~TRINITY_DN884_c0_g1_i1.p1  ORF type:complete len:607 (-),score=52.18 TRINITY_DN884_c0_g1_i1:79-1899(-)
MNKQAILLVILALIMNANSLYYRLLRFGTPTCESSNRFVLENIDETTCADRGCSNFGSAEYYTTTCGETERSFNESLARYGGGRYYSIAWYYIPGEVCGDLSAIEAKAVDSCEGAAYSRCQNFQSLACLYIEPYVPQASIPLAIPVSAAPIAELEAPMALVNPPTDQQKEPIAAPLTAPTNQQQAPVATVDAPTQSPAVASEERPLTWFEKFVIGFSMGGWGVAVLFVALYIYQRKQIKPAGYVQLETADDPEQPLPAPQFRPTIITSSNKNTIKPVLVEATKSKMLRITDPVIIDKTKKLGEGTGCEVFEGIWRQKRVAIKIPKDSDISKLMKELTVFSEVDPHPNIVEVYGYFEYKDRIHVVLELCNLPNLEELTKQGLSISDKFSIAMGIAAGMLHLHHSKRQVIHRDLKPKNILVTKSGSHLIPKIADFDHSRLLSSPAGVTYTTTTTSYAAPEQLALSANSRKEYSVKSDAWAYGATLFYLLTGQPPFKFQNLNALKTQRLNKQVTINFDLLDKLPIDPFTALMVDITRKCLQDEADKRPTFDKIDMEFQDFFNKFYPHGNNNGNNTNIQISRESQVHSRVEEPSHEETTASQHQEGQAQH